MVRLAQLPFIGCELYTTKVLLPYRDYTRRKTTHILRKKSGATVPARSTPQHQFDENQTIISRHSIKRQYTKKLHRNDGRTPMSSLRFYAVTYIITTYYLNNISVTCIFSCYLCSMIGS
jgi:hypothetical protein